MILPNMTQPQYPQTNINIDFPRGIQLSVILAPGVVLSTTLGPDMVEQLYANWQAAKQAPQKELDLIKHVQETKNNGNH